MSEMQSTCSQATMPHVFGHEVRPIEGFPGYAVCSNGTVWSRWRRGWSCAYIGESWRQLVAVPTGKSGYLLVTLCRDGKRINKRVHTAVAEAFIGPRPDEMECCHNNGITSDCSVCNLRYDTPINNQKDRVLHGTDSRGEKCVTAKLTATEVRFIREQLGKIGTTSLANRFGVTNENIRMIQRRKSWAHLE